MREQQHLVVVVAPSIGLVWFRIGVVCLEYRYYYNYFYALTTHPAVRHLFVVLVVLRVVVDVDVGVGVADVVVGSVSLCPARCVGTMRLVWWGRAREKRKFVDFSCFTFPSERC